MFREKHRKEKEMKNTHTHTHTQRNEKYWHENKIVDISIV